MISIKVIDVNFFVFLLFCVLFCWGWGGGRSGFVLGGGGGKDVVWGLFWGWGGCCLEFVLGGGVCFGGWGLFWVCCGGGGVLGEGLQGMIMKAEHQ